MKDLIIYNKAYKTCKNLSRSELLIMRNGNAKKVKITIRALIVDNIYVFF
jgi:hypothetical protein